MRDTSYKEVFTNSVWAHREDWPTVVLDMLEACDEWSQEIRYLETKLVRKIGLRDAMVHAAHDEAKAWFEAQAIEAIRNG